MFTTTKFEPAIMLHLADIDFEKQPPDVRAGLEALAKQQRLWAELALIDVEMRVEEVYANYDMERHPFPIIPGLDILTAAQHEPSPDSTASPAAVDGSDASAKSTS